jgi:hypothetical protein
MPLSRNPDRKTLYTATAALLAGLLLRLIFISIHPRWGGDTLVYGNLAENMLTHHVFGFSEETIRPTLIRLPGYPIFLAACFILFGHANYLAVVLVQLALDILGCILLGLLAARIFTPRAGLITLWLAALCPFTANYTAAALTETVSIFCVTLALFALERFTTHYRLGTRSLGWQITIGCALSFAVLVRPDQGLLAAAVIPAMLWLVFTTPSRSFTQRIAPAASATLIVLLPLLLWGIRNYRVFHVIQPLAPRYANDPGEAVDFGFQRWYRTWGIDFKSTYDEYWTYDGAPIDIATLPPRAFDSPAQRAETTALITRYNVEQSASPAFDAAFAHLAAERIATHPLRYYLTMPFGRVLNMWLRPRTELLAVNPPIPLDWWNFAPHPGTSTFALCYALLNAAFLAAGCIGLWRGWRFLLRFQAPLMIAMVGFVALRSALLLTIDNSEPRYVLECFPVVFLFAAASCLKLDSGPTLRQERMNMRAPSDSQSASSCPSSSQICLYQ